MISCTLEVGVSTITNPWKRKAIKLRVPTIPCGVFVGHGSKEGNLPWEFSINQGTEVESADEAGAQWVLRIGFATFGGPKVTNSTYRGEKTTVIYPFIRPFIRVITPFIASRGPPWRFFLQKCEVHVHPWK